MSGAITSTVGQLDDQDTTRLVVIATSASEENVAAPLLNNGAGGNRTTDIDGGTFVAFRKAQKAHYPGDCERWEEAEQANTISGHGTTTAELVAYSIVPEHGQGARLTASEVDTAPAVSTVTYGRRTDRGVRVASDSGVRRLTPLECERLMGWPDGWTAPDGVESSDSRRYGACGDGVVANVAEWIGRGIVEQAS